MAFYLLASNPIHGHVGPILQVAAHLVDEGNEVAVVTGSRFQRAVEATGAAFRPLEGTADYDDRMPDVYLPDRHRYRGVQQAQYDIRTIFVETIPDQYRSMRAALSGSTPDAILVDGAFGGALPLIASGTNRPPVIGLGVTPLSQSSRVLGPYGMALPPARTGVDRLRYAAMNTLARHVIFRPTQNAARRAFREFGLRLDDFVMDASRNFDLFLQTGPASLDYPRPDLSEGVHFVGVLPQVARHGELPEWWSDLDGDRPVVHVTQGTIDNHDFDRLVRPTLTALNDRDVLVVATAGGRPVDTIGPLPTNARAASYLSYDALLPRASVVVTNGGYGGVQAALAAGVPVIVAGDTEDKPEVAARVAWTGAGINLKTGTPDAASVRRAVDEVLGNQTYRAEARRIAADAAAHDALAEISGYLRQASIR
ncbi:MGT family glycosyltransferase [Microbacteriaceae bacterium SG_E_30_P1]|uniref:MGT family glycosyltransferase n=1 Tax=Antiquaquibacter oligotrophicus TaxID=2880260 RepID=A0ABT6KQ98_9MICO|nr:glycosyltransferase [Antiquaquibacter oligotrophicus]MDH6181960.1 MGT family glycosyltransferase [Antiquaquibacter oligotrophicus]UDF12371.1 glycosyltransferase [Antiquaquibacter oligotrophicus]